MRKSCFYILFILSICLFGFSTVKANTVAMGIKGDKMKLEPGDVIKLDLVVSCVADGIDVSKMDTGFEYDAKVFTVNEIKDVRYLNGWKVVSNSFNDRTGSFIVSLKAGASTDYIDTSMASSDCGDDTYVTLVSGYELKVKDVVNQKTTIWSLQDGARSTSIDVEIFKANDNSNLKELEIEGVEIEPSFSADITSYEAEVDYDKEEIVINATCMGDNCSISNTGNKKLQVGENRFEIVVTAEDGSKKKYNLFVNRKGASSDTSLSSLKIKDSNGNNISFGFKSDKHDYDITVDNDVLFVEFDVACNGINCEVLDVGTKKLDVGKNSVIVKVVAEDGTISEYNVNIVREKKKSIIPYIIGGIILIGIIVVGVMFFIKRNNNKKAKRTNVEPIQIEDVFDIDNLQ